MAIGLSQMFGYSCPENFIYPYVASSVSDFWRRWHVTLGSWFRDYVYIPMGGSRVGKARLVFNLFIVWFLTGIWHGAGLNFIVWGLAYFVAIALEKLTGIRQRIKMRPLKVLYSVLVVAFVNFQWVIFRANGIKAGIKYIMAMFQTSGSALSDVRASILLKEYFWLLVIAVIFCFPIVSKLKEIIYSKKSIKTFIGYAYPLAVFMLFVLSISIIVAGANNPFTYANF